MGSVLDLGCGTGLLGPEIKNHCSKLEGIIPALEPSHALAYLIKNSKKFTKKDIIIMNMCGRGDKDIFAISDKLGVKL